MLYDLLNVYAPTHCSSMPGWLKQRVMAAAPDHVAVRLVAEDGDVAAADEVGDAAASRPASSTPPVGLCGEFKKIARGDGSSFEEPLDVGDGRAGSRSLACSGVEHGARAAALDVRQVGREIRAEDEHAVAGIQERLAEELLEHLGAGARDDVARPRPGCRTPRARTRRPPRETRECRATGSSAIGCS